MCILVVLAYGLISAFLCWKILLWNKKGDILENVDKSSKFKRWDFLFKEINTKTKFTTYIVSLTIVKDFLFSPFIVLGISNANIQIIPILCLSILTAGFVVKTTPFKSKLENATIFTNSLCYVFILIIFLWLHNFTDHMSPKDRYNKLGSLCLFFICILLLLNLVVGFITIFEIIKEACKKRAKKDKPQLKQKAFGNEIKKK